MVRIIIRGKSQSILKEEAKEALSFFSDYLLGRRLSKNIYIHVTFDPSLFELHNELGYMSWTDVAARCPRKFIVKIDAQLNKEKALLLWHTRWYISNNTAVANLEIWKHIQRNGWG